MPNRTSRIGSFLAGLSALASVWPASHAPRYPHRSELDALRGDSKQIGSDMRRVMEREREKLKETA